MYIRGYHENTFSKANIRLKLEKNESAQMFRLFDEEKNSYEVLDIVVFFHSKILKSHCFEIIFVTKFFLVFNLSFPGS